MRLAELVPAWLPAVPLDPFSNRPLVYRITTNSFLLYSVGPDGKDDQGTSLKAGRNRDRRFIPDIALGFAGTACALCSPPVRRETIVTELRTVAVAVPPRPWSRAFE